MTTATPAAVAATATGAVVTLAAALDSPAAVYGALVGAVAVIVFFSFGAVVVGATASVMPSASLLVALLTYVLQVILLGLVFWSLPASLEPSWVAAAVIACTFAWCLGLIAAHIVPGGATRVTGGAR